MEKKLGPYQEFAFTCRMCGGCCRDDREIILNPVDIYRLSRHFGLPTGVFIDKYCDAEISNVYGGFPIVTLKTPAGTCIFLEGDLCRVHTVRPACCRNYPVGTSFTRDGGMEHTLMEVGPECRGMENGKLRTVAGWWKESGMEPDAPGITLMRRAFRAVSLRLSQEDKKQLYRILCDFDSLLATAEQKNADMPENELVQFLIDSLEQLFAGYSKSGT